MTSVCKLRGLESNQHRDVQRVLSYRLDDPASVVLLDHRQLRKVRGEGIEPSSSASKAGGLPLADPRMNESALRESNPPRQLGRLAPLPLGQGHIHSCGGRNRTCDGAINSRLSVPARNPPHQQVRTAGFEPAISCARGTRIPKLSHVLKSKERPAGIEPALPPWQDSTLPLHHGRYSVTTRLSEIESTGPDSNRRPRITGAESWPLDDQCLCFSRTRGIWTLTSPVKSRECCR